MIKYLTRWFFSKQFKAMLPCIGLKNQIFDILLIFSITFLFIYKLCRQAHCSHKNSALAFIRCFEISAIMRVSSDTNYSAYKKLLL
jgi:hypothetical protein